MLADNDKAAPPNYQTTRKTAKYKDDIIQSPFNYSPFYELNALNRML
jgi:hypothetical protein